MILKKKEHVKGGFLGAQDGAEVKNPVFEVPAVEKESYVAGNPALVPLPDEDTFFLKVEDVRI